MGNKELTFYCTKSDVAKPMCKTFSEWESYEKLVAYIRHDKVPENKVLLKLANDSQLKLGIIMENTGKGMPQRSYLTKDTADKARAMIIQANMPEEIKYKLCKERFSCATYVSNL